MIVVRPASSADVDQIDRISRSTGQPEADSGADPRYVRMLLAGATVLVASSDDRICGWGAVRTGPLGALLTDLFVEPDQQGRGVGRALLDALWPDVAQPRRLTFSSRHPNALPLYLRSGLHPVWPLLYLTGDPTPLPASSAQVRFVDADTAASTEGALVGGSRAADYRYWVEALDGRALIVQSAGRVVAAGARVLGRLVHLACPDREAAADALFAAARAGQDTNVEICVPGPHPASPELLRSGFRIDDYDVAMASADLTPPTTWAYSPALG